MKKNEIVKSKQYFNKIIQNQKYYKNNHFVIYIMKKETEKAFFGIAVSRKYGNAVERNKIKRITRNLIDKNKFLFPNYQDYIIMVKGTCKNQSYKLLNDSLSNLLKEKVNK